MRKRLWLGIALGIILGVMVILIPQSPLNDLRNRCCQECLTAFSQSPVGVGSQAARCGQFTTGSPLSQSCQEYFSSTPRTVFACENERAPASFLRVFTGKFL